MIEICSLIRKVADSIAASLEVYWPADAFDRNDPEEKFLSFHFAHVLLGDGFAVFAEADHPDPECRGIDLLAISKERDYFIAAEFKRHTFRSMKRSIDDVKRVNSFRLNKQLNPEQLGTEPTRVLKMCRNGVGLIAGLIWVPAGRSDYQPVDDEFSSRIDLHEGGTVGLPEFVSEYPSGSYFLQYAHFTSWRRDVETKKFTKRHEDHPS